MCAREQEFPSVPAGLRERGLLVKSVQRQCRLSQKAKSGFRTSKAFEASWSKTKQKSKKTIYLVRQRTNVVVRDVTLCMAPLLISPRTGFPRTKLGWSRATRDGVGKKSRLWGLQERTVGCTSGGVGHGIRQRKRTPPCSSIHLALWTDSKYGAYRKASKLFFAPSRNQTLANNIIFDCYKSKRALDGGTFIRDRNHFVWFHRHWAGTPQSALGILSKASCSLDCPAQTFPCVLGPQQPDACWLPDWRDQ